MKLAILLEGGEVVAAVLIRVNASGEAMMIVVPFGINDEAAQVRNPEGGRSVCRAVKAIVPRQGTSNVCDRLLPCIGDEALSGGRVASWEAHGDSSPHGRPAFGPMRNFWSETCCS